MYRTTVYVGCQNNKPKRITVRAETKEELDVKVKKLKEEIKAGNNVSENYNFCYWADKWLKEQKLPQGLNDGTINEYKSCIKHLNNYFANKNINQITLSEFQCLINDLATKNPNTDKPTGKKTLDSIKKVAKSIFNYANANKVPNICMFFKEVIIPKSAPIKTKRALSYEEQQMIIDTPHRCQTTAMIMLFAGLRRGELIPLTWNDIDLKNGYIKITKSVDLQSNSPILKEGGKTDAAFRLISIPTILKNYLKIKKNESVTELVCPNVHGRMHSKSSFDKMWSSYMYTLNLKYGYNNSIKSKCINDLPFKIQKFSSHYLRHTFATILYLQGIDVVTAKQLLGHKDVQVTINIYTDLNNNSLFFIEDEYRERLQTDYKIAYKPNDKCMQNVCQIA